MLIVIDLLSKLNRKDSTLQPWKMGSALGLADHDMFRAFQTPPRIHLLC